MSFWAGAGGAAIGGGLDLISGALNRGFARQQAKSAYKRSVHSYKHRYQWMVDDLVKAGLNPILALGHGPGSAPTATPLSAQQPTGGAIAGAVMASQVRQMNAAADKLSAEAGWAGRLKPWGELMEKLGYKVIDWATTDSGEISLEKFLSTAKQKANIDPQLADKVFNVIHGVSGSNASGLMPQFFPGKIEPNRPDTGYAAPGSRSGSSGQRSFREPYLRE